MGGGGCQRTPERGVSMAVVADQAAALGGQSGARTLSSHPPFTCTGA